MRHGFARYASCVARIAERRLGLAPDDVGALWRAVVFGELSGRPRPQHRESARRLAALRDGLGLDGLCERLIAAGELSHLKRAWWRIFGRQDEAVNDADDDGELAGAGPALVDLARWLGLLCRDDRELFQLQWMGDTHGPPAVGTWECRARAVLAEAALRRDPETIWARSFYANDFEISFANRGLPIGLQVQDPDIPLMAWPFRSYWVEDVYARIAHRGPGSPELLVPMIDLHLDRDAVMRGLAMPQWQCRQASCEVIARIGGNLNDASRGEAVAALRNTLCDPHEYVLEAAAEALSRIVPEGASAIPALVVAIFRAGDPDLYRRHLLITPLLDLAGFAGSGERALAAAAIRRLRRIAQAAITGAGSGDRHHCREFAAVAGVLLQHPNLAGGSVVHDHALLAEALAAAGPVTSFPAQPEPDSSPVPGEGGDDQPSASPPAPGDVPAALEQARAVYARYAADEPRPAGEVQVRDLNNLARSLIMAGRRLEARQVLDAVGAVVAARGGDGSFADSIDERYWLHHLIGQLCEDGAFAEALRLSRRLHGLERELHCSSGHRGHAWCSAFWGECTSLLGLGRRFEAVQAFARFRVQTDLMPQRLASSQDNVQSVYLAGFNAYDGPIPEETGTFDGNVVRNLLLTWPDAFAHARRWVPKPTEPRLVAWYIRLHLRGGDRAAACACLADAQVRGCPPPDLAEFAGLQG